MVLDLDRFKLHPAQTRNAHRQPAPRLIGKNPDYLRLNAGLDEAAARRGRRVPIKPNPILDQQLSGKDTLLPDRAERCPGPLATVFEQAQLLAVSKLLERPSRGDQR